jgi:hypothetical protein
VLWLPTTNKYNTVQRSTCFIFIPLEVEIKKISTRPNNC